MRTLFILTAVALMVFPTAARSQENLTSLKSQPSVANAGPTRLALKVFYFNGAAPTYQGVPGPVGKRSGGWFGSPIRGLPCVAVE